MKQFRKMKALVACAAVGLAVAGAKPVQADLMMGQTLRYSHEYPSQGSISSGPFNVLVGSGVEHGLVSANPNTDPYARIDVSDNNIFIDFVSSAGFGSAAFNGIHYFDINGTIPNFTGFTLASTNLSLTQSDLSFDANNLWVNFENVAFDSNSFVSLNVAPAAVATPEPGTWAMMGIGLCGVVLMGRKKKLTGKALTLA